MCSTCCTSRAWTTTCCVGIRSLRQPTSSKPACRTRPSPRVQPLQAPGGGDPLVLWGLPTSTAVNVAAVGTVFVVRTQRAAFQEWVDGAPWAAPGEVTVVLAGDLAKDFDLLPPDAVVPEAAPRH